MGLIHTPPLLFLDEPSTGLDPQNRVNLQEHIRRLHDEYGTTIVLTTHYLDEADALAERIVVIDHGQLIADDSPARLKSEHVGDRIALTFDTESSAARAASHVAVIDGRVDVQGAAITISVPEGTHLVPKLLRGLDEAGLAVTAVEVKRPTLDDVFLALTGRSLREGAATSTEQEVAA
jgi:ABC-2 type transport system ATP-binding protein